MAVPTTSPASQAQRSRAPDQLDAFISYARRDQEFVGELAAALEARGRTVWIDADDIPPGAPWRRELGTAIEAAQAIVFVISPDSATSPECAAELRRADELNKRIVPVLHRDARGLPESLTSLQFIVVRDIGAIPEAVKSVEHAIDTDHEWVRAHTHWGARALRWVDRGRDASLLLRGSDLRAAEDWLAQQAEAKSPRPTPLQTEFIVTSRHAERRRLRTLVAAALGAVAVTLALAAVALLQRSEAIDQRNQARSRELAASAVTALDADPERTLLLALESDRVARTPQTVDALRRGLAASHVRAVMRGHDAAVTRVLISSDPSRIASGSRDGTARLWDDRGRELAVLRHDGPLVELAATPDGRTLATASEDGTARVWDLTTGAGIATLRGHRGTVADATVDRAGQTVATAGEDGTVRRWDARSGAQRAVMRDHQGRVNGAAISPDGRWVLSGGDDGTVRLWDGGSRSRLLQRTGAIDTVAFSARGDTAVTMTRSGSVTVWSARTWRPIGSRDGAFSVALSSDSEKILTTSIDGTATVWSARRGEPSVTLHGHVEPALGAAFSRDGRLAATTGVDGTARVWDAATGQSLAVLRGHTGNVHRVAFQADGNRIVTAGGDGTARLWDVGQPVALGSPLDVQVTSAEMSPDGRYVVTSSRDVRARLFDPATGEVVTEPPGCERPAWWVESDPSVSCFENASMTENAGVNPLDNAAWAPDGHSVVTSGENGVSHVFDPFSGRVRAEFVTHDGEVYRARFSRDGARVVTASADGTARVWRTRDGRELTVLRGHGSGPGRSGREVIAAAFSPDGGRVATAGEDGTVRIWNAGTGRQITVREVTDGLVLDVDWSPDGRHIVAPVGEVARSWAIDGWRPASIFRGHDGLVSTASFSSRGTLVVTGGFDGTARVWDATTGEQVTTLPGHEQTVLSARMSRDGRFVVTSSEDGTALVHACAACGGADALAALARERVTRRLTSEERERYLGQGAR
jgi:WD40 repeat protein